MHCIPMAGFFLLLAIILAIFVTEMVGVDWTRDDLESVKM
jgi:hypothetical protein